jgi:hypothetical protein
MRGSSTTLLFDSLPCFTAVLDDEWWLERVSIWRVLLRDVKAGDPDDDVAYFGLWRDGHAVDLYDTQEDVLAAIMRAEHVSAEDYQALCRKGE